MNTIFMNSGNSKTSDPHRLLLDLKKKRINILLNQIIVFTMHGKILKSHIRIINLNHQLQNGIKNLNYLMDHTLYQIFKIILNIY